jgi:hypothetical protein
MIDPLIPVSFLLKKEHGISGKGNKRMLKPDCISQGHDYRKKLELVNGGKG